MKINTLILIFAIVFSLATQAEELKNGSCYTQQTFPSLLIAKAPPAAPVRFSLEVVPSSKEKWEYEFNKDECELKVEKRSVTNNPSNKGTPDPYILNFEIISRVQTPARIEFLLAIEENGVKRKLKQTRFMLYTAQSENISPIYPEDKVFTQLKSECKQRGIEITDWHIHIRGGMTPEDAAKRELLSGIRSTAMENHGREWEIFDNEKLRNFADAVKKIKINGRNMPVGIQVNDRDWFQQIDEKTRAKFDYILADTMIMGKLPNGRDNRLWLVKEIADPNKWMEEYMNHNMQILSEPIDILANPTYLPAPIAAQYDKLWTEERMKKIISKAIEKGIALEIQATSPFPNERFLKLAKQMGAKFSFGTNNFDPRPKDLSRWLEVIKLIDLKANDIWTPKKK